MSPWIENISGALTPRKKHFEKVWLPEWEKIDEQAQREDFPYSVVLDNLLVATIGSVEVDFCTGPFSGSLKKIEGDVVRKVMAVYAYFAVLWFARTEFCTEMTEAYPQFTVDGLWARFAKLVPEWAPIDAKIDETVRAESDPTTLFAHVLSGVVWQATGKGPDNTREWHQLPSSFARLITELVKTIEQDVIQHEKEETAKRTRAATAEPAAPSPGEDARDEEIALPSPGDKQGEKAESPTSQTELTGWVKTRCPTCGRKLKATREKAGKKAVCPSCKTSFQIPEHGDRRL